jgi:hypothetical protein
MLHYTLCSKLNLYLIYFQTISATSLGLQLESSQGYLYFLMMFQVRLNIYSLLETHMQNFRCFTR